MRFSFVFLGIILVSLIYTVSILSYIHNKLSTIHYGLLPKPHFFQFIVVIIFKKKSRPTKICTKCVNKILNGENKSLPMCYARGIYLYPDDKSDVKDVQHLFIMP